MTDREPDAVDLFPEIAHEIWESRPPHAMPPSEAIAEVLDVADRAWDVAVREERERHWDAIAEELGL